MKTLPPSSFHQLCARIQALAAAGDILPLFRERNTRAFPVEYVREVATIKRFLERWTGDPEFRARTVDDPNGAAAARGLALDAAAARMLWDPDVALATPIADWPLPVLRYRAFVLEKFDMVAERRRNHPSLDPRYAEWRTRQLRRTQYELPPVHAGNLVHAPFCIELCNGCSVGCWFCGISAPKLSDIFLRTPENKKLYGSVLETMHEVFGESTGQGFCYWATDPMDNPDYEPFLIDFHEHTGEFPQTTTALALKDLVRTRKLLELSREKNGRCDRFSLLTLKQLDKVHQAFSPEELLYVELVLQNKEHFSPKISAGRAGDERPAKHADQPGNQLTAGTIACVSGFLVNLVTRTVKLISPCAASARWPLGYIVYAEGRFADADGFRTLVRRMVDEQMRPALRPDDPVAFHEHLRYAPTPGGDGFELRTPDQALQLSGSPLFAVVGDLLGRAPAEAGGGGFTVDRVLDEVLAQQAEADPAEVLYTLQLLHDGGLIDTLPRTRPAADVVQLRV
jgi:radical SAM family RiPP maturation amino acid epimerase